MSHNRARSVFQKTIKHLNEKWTTFLKFFLMCKASFFSFLNFTSVWRLTIKRFQFLYRIDCDWKKCYILKGVIYSQSRTNHLVFSALLNLLTSIGWFEGWKCNISWTVKTLSMQIFLKIISENGVFTIAVNNNKCVTKQILAETMLVKIFHRHYYILIYNYWLLSSFYNIKLIVYVLKTLDLKKSQIILLWNRKI